VWLQGGNKIRSQGSEGGREAGSGQRQARYVEKGVNLPVRAGCALRLDGHNHPPGGVVVNRTPG